MQISNIPRLGWVARSNALTDSTSGKRTITDEPDVVEAIVVMRKGENPTQVISAMKKKIEKLNNSVLPADTQIVPYYDRDGSDRLCNTHCPSQFGGRHIAGNPDSVVVYVQLAHHAHRFYHYTTGFVVCFYLPAPDGNECKSAFAGRR